MFISFLNTIKKTIYIIFTLIFLSIILSDHSLASNHILAVEELEISKEIDLKFSRNKIIDDAFKKAFYRLLSQILNSSDIKKLKNVNNLKISCNDADMQIATKAINDGAIVVFPTDTVYGLGCNPYNHDAVLSLYEIKKRKKTKPFPVIGYSKKELEKIAEFNSLEEKIAEKFWPGPITLILKIKDKEIQKSLDLEGKIAVRVPNNQCVLALLKECKLLVGTSANISGTAPFNDPKECRKNLSGYDLLIDGGIISGQGESTIVEIENNDVKILRKGNVSEEMIKALT